MNNWQTEITLEPRKRGFHLIDPEILKQLPQLHNCHIGVLNLFIQHSSASLTINENADPTVRIDMESHFNQYVPENAAYYLHTFEGADDMPAHIKASILGSAVQIPVNNGKLLLGVWQGIYLGEHRDHACKRNIIATYVGS
ncbi:secondary thiamine-phosphate synthase enzyme YjbQ [Psychrosphaera aquimarina]|uniref:Secondary thiamine-phosphate synthase enzyme YjbQ n=1 Tax=Psychrosphaera aquimarina TaxID=2044854 RepID=A0ABU3R1W5_9GAMM|nr:secondary thiamine-phosphate synthase enzyme YjbQ [Psychrosphaera aquimarina]MDU0113664.1 secondary thiamine-phosphate synthase enzyme YjbQ [Psychrosphaera aquimarina]